MYCQLFFMVQTLLIRDLSWLGDIELGFGEINEFIANFSDKEGFYKL